MRRTIKLTEAKVIVNTENGMAEMLLLMDGRVSEQKILKKAKEVVVEGGKVIGVLETNQIQKTYECSLDDFISISEEVELEPIESTEVA